MISRFKAKHSFWIGAALLCVLVVKCSTVIEKLADSVAVSSWSEDGLRLADGRKIQLPGFSKLPKNSKALAEATKRGIEISADGRVFGLVKIHHWCGNDPIRWHIARVDIAQMLVFLGEGELKTALTAEEKNPYLTPPYTLFSEHGWNASGFRRFTLWSKSLKEQSTKLNAVLALTTNRSNSP